MRTKLLSTLCLLPSLALAQRTDGTPTLTLPFASTANPISLSAQELNPAALATLQSWALGFFGDFPSETDAQNTGNFLSLGFGGASGLYSSLAWSSFSRVDDLFDPAQLIPNEVNKASLSLAARLGSTFFVGATFSEFFADQDPALDEQKSLDLGFLYRPSRFLSLALTGYDLREIAFTDAAGTRQLINPSLSAGLALRPLGNEKLALTADLGVSGDGALRPRASAALQLGKSITLRSDVGLAEQADGSLALDSLQVGLSLHRPHAGVTVGVETESKTTAVGVYASGEKLSLATGGSQVIEMTLTGEISEQSDSSNSIYGLVSNLESASKDKSIRALVLRMGGISASAAQIEELHRAIAGFRKAGKKCIVYMDAATGRDYQLAVACDRVYLSPAGSLMLAGLSSDLPFYKGTFEKLGVEPQFVRIGKYKSAPESYTETGPTPENTEVREQLLDEIYANLVAQIAVGRRKTEAEVRALIDEGPSSAEKAKSKGLIDGTIYYDELKRQLEREFGASRWRDGFDTSPEALPWGAQDKVAVVVVQGAITKGDGGFSLLGGQSVGDNTIIKALQEVRENPSIKAVVLRIDSPGGDALASDLIWHEVERVKAAKKPVIVSMGGVAASGGYYIAAGADEIFADKTTITGSIGIFGGKFVLKGLYDKIGLQYYSLKRGARADWNSTLRPWTEEEQAAYMNEIGEFYKIFTSKVAQGRGMTVETVDSLGQGHVYTGAKAKEIKLVTREGGLAEALDFACEKANVGEKSEVVLLPKSSPSLLSSLLSGAAKSQQQVVLPPMVQEMLDKSLVPLLVLDPTHPWMLWPETVEIK